MLIRIASIASNNPTLLNLLHANNKTAVTQDQIEIDECRKTIKQLDEELKKEQNAHMMTKTKYDKLVEAIDKIRDFPPKRDNELPRFDPQRLLFGRKCFFVGGKNKIRCDRALKYDSRIGIRRQTYFYLAADCTSV
eukprot:GILJ01036201.1.p1 GENE.GILJ01036201.1~~GILJ01036201.1.p1  ORF type:complete len:136 (+),score=20.27 GILJ01036201.1:869-1276(+)